MRYISFAKCQHSKIKNIKKSTRLTALVHGSSLPFFLMATTSRVNSVLYLNQNYSHYSMKICLALEKRPQSRSEFGIQKGNTAHGMQMETQTSLRSDKHFCTQAETAALQDNAVIRVCLRQDSRRALNLLVSLTRSRFCYFSGQYSLGAAFVLCLNPL